jgi:NitT/TauT family transport system permease protein/sulfonate transport system permease protein
MGKRVDHVEPSSGLSPGSTQPTNKPAISLDTAVRLAFLLAVAAGWTVAARTLPSYLVPSPAAVAQDMWALVSQEGLRRHILTTLLHILSAVAIATVLAFTLVLTARAMPLLEPLIERRLTPLLNAFPAIGWTLLGILWLGLDSRTVVFAIAAMLLPFNVINLSQGLRAMNAELLELAASLTTSRLRRFRLVVLPLLAPFLFATLRLNLGVSWKVALTAELLGGNRGLGFLMNLGMQDQNTTRILAISLLIVLIVYLTDVQGLAALQGRFNARFKTA